jgi:hypothetical protein
MGDYLYKVVRSKPLTLQRPNDTPIVAHREVWGYKPFNGLRAEYNDRLHNRLIAPTERSWERAGEKPKHVVAFFANCDATKGSKMPIPQGSEVWLNKAGYVSYYDHAQDNPSAFLRAGFAMKSGKTWTLMPTTGWLPDNQILSRAGIGQAIDVRTSLKEPDEKGYVGFTEERRWRDTKEPVRRASSFGHYE